MSGIIDKQALNGLQALNPDDGGEFVREVVNIYLTDAPERLVAMDAALARGDVTVFSREAHSMKGSSANVGATAVRAAAEHLEHAAKREGLAGVGPGLETLKAAFAAAKAELTTLTKR